MMRRRTPTAGTDGDTSTRGGGVVVTPTAGTDGHAPSPPEQERNARVCWRCRVACVAGAAVAARALRGLARPRRRAVSGEPAEPEVALPVGSRVPSSDIISPTSSLRMHASPLVAVTTVGPVSAQFDPCAPSAVSCVSEKMYLEPCRGLRRVVAARCVGLNATLSCASRVTPARASPHCRHRLPPLRPTWPRPQRRESCHGPWRRRSRCPTRRRRTTGGPGAPPPQRWQA